MSPQKRHWHATQLQKSPWGCECRVSVLPKLTDFYKLRWPHSSFIFSRGTGGSELKHSSYRKEMRGVVLPLCYCGLWETPSVLPWSWLVTRGSAEVNEHLLTPTFLPLYFCLIIVKVFHSSDFGWNNFSLVLFMSGSVPSKFPLKCLILGEESPSPYREKHLSQ